MFPYSFNINKAIFKHIRRLISIIVLAAFISTSVKIPAYAQVLGGQMPHLPLPGVLVHLSPEFTPAHLQGITIHPDNALQFDFLIHKGDQDLEGDQKKVEYMKLVKYFLASLTIPDEDQWVNLSPYEHDRIIKDDFGKTEMGRDLLAEDYMLKQITSSLIYPEDNLGKKFWDKIYARAWNEYHTTNIPVNTFNKVWIVPDQAYVYESGNTAYILKSHLKVMLEEDYLSLQKHSGITSTVIPAQAGIHNKNDTHTIASQVIREIILPELEREVNEDKSFASLRQMYSGMILATWYKKALKKSLLGKIYADKSKVKGIDQDPKTNELIYKRYLRAFKKGVFNYIKEDVDKYTNEEIPRKYFSGGWKGFVQAVYVGKVTDFKSSGVLFIVKRAMFSLLPQTIIGSLNNIGIRQYLERATMNFAPFGGAAAKSNGYLNRAMAHKPVALVADDEPMVLKLNKRVLEGEGYEVLTVDSPDKIGEFMEKYGDGINLWVTDSSGWIEKVARILTDRKSKGLKIPKILAVSGKQNKEDWDGVPIDAFLSKPYNIMQLRNAVNELLPPLKAAAASAAMVGRKEVILRYQNLFEREYVDKNPFTLHLLNRGVLFISKKLDMPKNDPVWAQAVRISADDYVITDGNGGYKILRDGETVRLGYREKNAMRFVAFKDIEMRGEIIISRKGNRIFWINNLNDTVTLTYPVKTILPKFIRRFIWPSTLYSLSGGFRTTPKSKSKPNEDAGFVDEKIGLLFVADGLSESPEAALASSIARDTVKQLLTKEKIASFRTEADVKQYLRIVVGNVQKKILANGKGIGRTTFNLNLIWQDPSTKKFKVFVVNKGDSRSYIMNANGSLKQLTKDDGPVQRLVDAGVIKAEKAEVHADRNQIDDFLGDQGDAELRDHQLKVYEIKKGQTVLAMTDGISDLLGNELMNKLAKIYRLSLERLIWILEDSATKVHPSDLRYKSPDDRTLGFLHLAVGQDAALLAHHNSSFGGIDFNSANLAMIIKRDGKGVPLPIARQDMAQLSRITGFDAEIVRIGPAINEPIINELEQKLQSSSPAVP